MQKIILVVCLCVIAVNATFGGVYDNENVHYTEDGDILWGGDMVLTPEQIDDLYNTDPIDTRKTRRGKNVIWPKGEVLFKISESSEKDRDIILKAIKHWMDNTCLKFFPTGGSSGIPHIIFKKLKGCYSAVGRNWWNTGGQTISIGRDCNNLGTIAHEIGHAIGFYHEQNRPDRDKYIIVFPENINPNETKQFDIFDSIITLGIPYDINSVMHYGTHYFSFNGLNTMSPIDPLDEFKLGQIDGLSFLDIKTANILYNCSDSCRDPPACLNDGFVDKDCKCVCPPGFTGSLCETTVALPASPCGGVITEPTVVTSPNFPENPPPKSQCVWHVKAPEGKKVQVHFRHFELRPRGVIYLTCTWDFLEVRSENSIYHGKKYCKDELQDNTTVSEKNFLLLLYKSFKGDYKGFEADITFV